MRQLLVFQLNGIHRILSELHGLSRNDRDRLASPDTLPVDRETDGLRQTLHVERRALGCKDFGNARHRLGLAHVQFGDLAMRDRTAQNLDMQQIGDKLIIVAGKKSLASCLIISIHTNRGLTNVVIGCFFRRITHNTTSFSVLMLLL